MRRKACYYALIVCVFIAMLGYNILTPYMSDDFWYDLGHLKSISELIDKINEIYFGWNARLIPQSLMVVALAIPKPLFNVLNSAMLVLLGILIYCNIKVRQKYDIPVLLLTYLMIWLFVIDPGQTIIWLGGSCNYLWATVISLGYLTLYRFFLEKCPENSWWKCILFLLMGICAGWCNENTSGAILLLVLYFVYRYPSRKPSWCYCGILGEVIGLIGLVSSPGAHARLADNMTDESSTGILAYLGRLLKLNDYVVQYFSVIGICLIILITYAIVSHKINKTELVDIFAFIFAALAAIYVLLITTTPMPRALFGAQILVMIACINMVTMLRDDDRLTATLQYSAITVMLVWGSISYIKNAANLYRIDRELLERATIVEEHRTESVIRVPMLREEWNNKYTFIYMNDVSEEDDAWGNSIYALHYDVESIQGVPRDQWDEEQSK